MLLLTLLSIEHGREADPVIFWENRDLRTIN